MRILLASPIDEAAIDYLRRTHDVVLAIDADEEEFAVAVGDCEAVVFRSGVTISARCMARAPNLRLLIRAGCGLDNVDSDYAYNRGIALHSIPEPAAQAVAEMAFALMLALARDLREADRLLRQGHWAKHALEGRLLSGNTLGIVGVGNIGTRVGQLGVAWGMRALGCVGHPSPEVAAKLGAQGIKLVAFDELMARADFVCLHVPLADTTRNLVDARVLARMKPGAMLVNMSRGGVVDEAALYEALVEGGRLRGAALDVHCAEGEGLISPLAGLPNVILTPHIGSTTEDTQRQIGARVVEIVEEYTAAQATARLS